MAEENHIIAKIGMDENPPAKEPIFISLASFKNSKYLDIRKYYNDNGEWKPTKKGVTMNLQQLKQFIETANAEMTQIESWFSSKE